VDAKTGRCIIGGGWRAGLVQLQSAYAFMLSGVVELYEATLDPKQLDFAIALADGMIARFADKEAGGFWQSAGDAPDLILRVKEDYDGAEPSGNSVAILALFKLAAITERRTIRRRGGWITIVRETSAKFFHRPFHIYYRHLLFLWRSRNGGVSGDLSKVETRRCCGPHSVINRARLC